MAQAQLVTYQAQKMNSLKKSDALRRTDRKSTKENRQFGDEPGEGAKLSVG